MRCLRYATLTKNYAVFQEISQNKLRIKLIGFPLLISGVPTLFLIEKLRVGSSILSLGTSNHFPGSENSRLFFFPTYAIHAKFICCLQTLFTIDSW